MEFRTRLIETLRAIEPVLSVPGVLLVGSEIPNLLEPSAASTLVVSEDVDVGVPVAAHAEVKRRLEDVRGLAPSRDEPSVWVPVTPGLIEVNFVGIDRSIRTSDETYVLEDDRLPLMVFGLLSLLREGPALEIDGLRLPVPRVAGLLLEKLVTERSGRKGDRDLLVVLGLLVVATEPDLAEVVDELRGLPRELRDAARSNLAVLSLLEPVDGMPDPVANRRHVADLLRRLEAASP